MAKRLNKKVAIIGSLILALLVIVAILVILNLSKDPQKYLQDAKTALALEEPDYKAAQKAYGRAFAYAKDTQLKIDILFMLAEMYIDNNEWPKAAGCWNKITIFDTNNKKARLALLDYSYQLATFGSWTVWKEVESNVAELIEKKLDTSPKMYRMKGQAILELTKRGQKTDRGNAINEAIENLQEAQKSEPNNVDTYQYLADAIIQKGIILAAGGVLGADENARLEAVKVLKSGIENIPQNPEVYINLYNTKLQDAYADPNKLEELENDIKNLSSEFKSSPLPYFALTKLYQRNMKDVDKAIEAASKAHTLDSNNVTYALTIANLLYRRYSVSKKEEDFQKAIKTATEALSYPDSLDIPGPRARISFMNRFSLHTFLANCYTKRAAKLAEKNEKTVWLDKGENEVHQINQLLGSAENPYTIMWKGRILLAKGDRENAIVQLNTAYNLLTASGQTQADSQLGRLSYELAKAFQNTNEIGAVIRFISTAIRNGIYYSNPEVILDWADALIKTKNWQQAIEAVDFFEKNFPANEMSQNLRISAYLGANMLEKAEEVFSKTAKDDPNTIRLQFILLDSKITKSSWELAKIKSSVQEQDDNSSERIESEIKRYKKEQIQVMNKLFQILPQKIN